MTSAKRSAQQFNFADFDKSLEDYRKRGSEFNAALLRKVVDFSQPEKFAEFCDLFGRIPIMDRQLYVDKSREELRELFMHQLIAVIRSVPLTPAMDEFQPEVFYALGKALIAVDIGLEARATVHICLYYDTIRELGSEKHAKYYERVYSFQDYGCFALTELGHGSNANGIETVARYEHASRSFLLHTPNPLAAKFWIGAAGKTANMAAVLAHLMIGETDYGLHAFLVPIRDYDTHNAIPGVILGDCGPKVGVDGIDNGFIIFQNYRVPYDALLDKFSQITPQGEFRSSISSKTKRFAAMLSGLFRGRSGVFMASCATLRNALTIAIRFSAVRRQFSLASGGEVPILDYQQHRYRLMPHLANFFAAQMGCEQFIADFRETRAVFRRDPEHSSKEEVHAIASVMKVLSSVYAMAGLQECREACGGLGYSAFSTFGAMKTAMDVATTWEGANHVLAQQTAKFVLKGAQSIIKGQKCLFTSLQELKLVAQTGKVSSDRLRDNPPILIEFAAYKLNKLVQSSMLHLQENAGKCKDMLDTWNHSQVHHLFDVSLAYGELYYLNLLLKKHSELLGVCASTAALFLRICELYALSKVEKDLALYRDGDYMTTQQAQAVKRYVVDLCEELGESAVRVIDAIALPDHIVGSPLGRADGQVYRHFTNAVEGGQGVYTTATWFPLLQSLRGPQSKL